jgi:hypothetical protein
MFLQFFGRQQVEHPDGTPRPWAQVFFNEVYKINIGGGGCVGMSAGSTLHYWRAEQRLAGDYRIPPPRQGFWARLTDAPPDVVSPTVSYYHGAQTSREVTQQYQELAYYPIFFSPKWQYDRIQRYLDNGIPVVVRIEIDDQDWSHVPPKKVHRAHMMLVYDVITPPYGNIRYLRVYDPNHPRDQHRQIEVNWETDTWSYFWDEGSTWSGGKYCTLSGGEWRCQGPLNFLSFHPVTVFLKPGILPGLLRSPAGADLQMVNVNGPARPLFVDDQGRRFGYVGDTFVNEIPDAFVFPGAGQGTDPIADESYFLPLTRFYTVSLFGTGEGAVDFNLFSDTDSWVAFPAPIEMIGVEGIHVGSGTQHQLEMDSRGVSFTSRRWSSFRP